MKKLILNAALLGGLVLSAVLLTHCRRAYLDAKAADPAELITSARSYFVDTLLQQSPIYKPDNSRNERTQRSKDIAWSSAVVTMFRGQPAVVAPVHFDKDIFVRTTWGGNNYFRMDNHEQLLLYRDSAHGWHAELVTLLPDSLYLQSKQQQFTGIALVDDWWGNPLHKYQYERDGRVTRYVPNNNQAADPSGKIATGVRSQAVTTICSYIYGYNYTVGDESNGVSWVEFGGCSIMYVPDGGEGGGYSSIGSPGGQGGGGGAPSSPPPPTPKPKLAFRPKYIISDIQKYFQCFELSTSATFQVTVAVKRPAPGTRKPWVLDNDEGSSGSTDPFNVGHSFLILTETFPGGRTVTRNIGFYPSQDVTPASDPVPGVYNDDEQTQFNIGGQYALTSNLFFAMLNYITNASGSYYQVNTNNCTNFVLDALGAGHIYLPHTIGAWIMGMGVDPGDLGEDIRANNFIGMTRITTPFIHPNVWDCN